VTAVIGSAVVPTFIVDHQLGLFSSEESSGWCASGPA
jgi:hypothetical protein